MRNLILVTAFALLTTGCGAMMAPVLDIQNAPVALPAGIAPSPARTRAAIVVGLADRGWTIDKEEGQTIVATVSSGGHTATVGIDYTPESYSIHYVTSSPGLKYDGLEIHKRYNHWVDRLRVSINKALAESPAQEPAGPAPAPAPEVSPVAPVAPAAPAPAAPADTAMPPAPPPPA